MKEKHRGLFTKEQLSEITGKYSAMIRLESFVSQLSILSHPATRVFLTHAGLNSVHESLYYGVPMIAMPMMLTSDQPTNAARIEELGVGVWVDLRDGQKLGEKNLDAILQSFIKPSSSYHARAHQLSSIVQHQRGLQRAGDLLEMSLPQMNYPALVQPAHALDASASGMMKIQVYVIFSSIFVVVALLNIFFLKKCARFVKGKIYGAGAVDGSKRKTQ